ncbi:hypothetical protein SERLA73DRAFT_142933, partial [Serpula lacrymans var. lacrymans S7.3]
MASIIPESFIIRRQSSFSANTVIAFTHANRTSSSLSFSLPLRLSRKRDSSILFRSISCLAHSAMALTHDIL